MNKTIELKTNDALFYKHYLRILNGLSELSSPEIELLAELMRIAEFDDNVLEHVDPDTIGMSSHQVKLLVKKFKDKGLLVMLGDHFHLNERIYVPKEDCNVTFRLKLI